MLNPSTTMVVGRDLVYGLDKIDGHEFEAAMVELFRRMGYATERGKLSNDEGRDIVLRSAGSVVVVECKHQASAVGRPVVQKLHSATLMYRNATQGIVVTTSSFADSAHKYANDVNCQSAINIELWDHLRLVREARSVGVYFVASRLGTNLFFWVPWREDSALREFLRSKRLCQIKSSPRRAVEAVQISTSQRRTVPALLLDYCVKKSFATSVGTVHTVSEHGRRIYQLGESDILPDEEKFWAQSEPTLKEDSVLDGKEVPTYFRQPVDDLVSELKVRVARQLSRSVQYRGRNNQCYAKWCEVRPDEVQIQTKHVLYSRWRLGLAVGPKQYVISLPDDATRDPLVIADSGFGAGVAGQPFMANEILCNDCGLIVPNSGTECGFACQGCGRTLCHGHAWVWPRLLRRSPRLCSSCYRSRREQSPELDVSGMLCNYWSSLLLSFVPGLALFLSRNYAQSIWIWLLALALAAAGWKGYIEPQRLVVVCSMVWLGSIGLTLFWTSRFRLHKRNVQTLTKYQPDWEARK